MTDPRIHLEGQDGTFSPELQSLLLAHRQEMLGLSPAESVHALDLEALRRPGLSFWSLWSGDRIMGCGALKELDPRHGELKSMRTAPAFLRQGVARRILEHLIAVARERGYTRLSLETGTHPAFDPARRLYEAFGFTECPPFGDYGEDPHSVCMTREL